MNYHLLEDLWQILHGRGLFAFEESEEVLKMKMTKGLVLSFDLTLG